MYYMLKSYCNLDVYVCVCLCVGVRVRVRVVCVCVFVCLLALNNNLLFISVFKDSSCVAACGLLVLGVVGGRVVVGRAVVVSSAVTGTETIAGATLLTIFICLTLTFPYVQRVRVMPNNKYIFTIFINFPIDVSAHAR